jgi:hypothetical protein
VPENELQQEQREPSDLEKFQAQIQADLRQGLGQFAQGVNQRLGAIEQRVAQPAPQHQPQVPLGDLEAANSRLREKMIADPIGTFKEVIGVAAQQGEERAKAIIEAERREAMLSSLYQNFWGGFSQYNQDVAEFQAQVDANLRRMGIDPMQMLQAGRTEDLSRYADQAANQVRQTIAQRMEYAQQQQARQKQGRAAAAGAPGSQFMPAAAQQEYEQVPERRDPKAELHEAVDELAQQRSKRMWNQIDTKDYRDTSRAREERVAQDKYVANGRRR